MDIAVEEDLARLVNRYEDAFNANDAAAMNRLFAADATFVNFSGSLVRNNGELLRAQQFVFQRGGPLEAVSVSYAVEQITHLGVGLAAVHARQRTAPAQDGTTAPLPDPMEAMFLLVASRIDSDWRIVLGQNTPVTLH